MSRSGSIFLSHPWTSGLLFGGIYNITFWLTLGLPTYFIRGVEEGTLFACFAVMLIGLIMFVCLNVQAHSVSDTWLRGSRFSVSVLGISALLLIAETIFIATGDVGALDPNSSMFAGLAYIVVWMFALFDFGIMLATAALQTLVHALRDHSAEKKHKSTKAQKENNHMKKIAVITGASSGMGREFAVQLDAQKTFDELWLIARRRERLEEIQAHVRAKVRAIPLDLTREDSIEEYEALLKAETPEIAVMVNAGGTGRFGKTEEIPLNDQYRMIDLNTKALVGMTLVSLPYFKAGSQIYQLGSMSSFQPVPYINTYGATKAFVLSFTRALNVEWKSRGIHLMAVCPHWVKTEFFDHAVKDDTICYYNKFYTAKEVVTRALKDMAKGKDVSVCGWSARAQVRMVKLLPHSLIMKIWCKQQKK